MNGSTVTAEENTTLSVEFFIIQHNCSDTVENVTVSISKEGENKHYAVQCIIRQRNRKCLNRMTSCGCHPDTNAENGIVYKFTKTVTRSDMVPWKWWTEGDVVTKREIQFNISCMLSLSVSVRLSVCLSVCLSVSRSLARWFPSLPPNLPIKQNIIVCNTRGLKCVFVGIVLTNEF